jgi:hypothetical protein
MALAKQIGGDINPVLIPWQQQGVRTGLRNDAATE